MNSIKTQLSDMLGCDEQQVIDGLMSLHNKGILNVKVIGIDDKGDEILEIKLLQECPEMEQQLKDSFNITAH